jgi:hypothetical protein
MHKDDVVVRYLPQLYVLLSLRLATLVLIVTSVIQLFRFLVTNSTNPLKDCMSS